MVTQEQIINEVKNNPGIFQSELHRRLGGSRSNICHAIHQLRKKKMIKRIPYNKIWRLYEAP